MKLSQPRSARVINTSRVLCALRTGTGLSKASLAQQLGLNKVSTGEIVDDLIRRGYVAESGKLEAVNGRRPTALELVKGSIYVLAVDIGRRNTTTALCGLDGEVLKMERIPTASESSVEEFCVSIIKSCMRNMKLVPAEYVAGVGVTVDGTVSRDGKSIISCQYLPWGDFPIADAFAQTLHKEAVITDSTAALVCAEKAADPGLAGFDSLLYLNWGSSVELAIVSRGRAMSTSREFGHIKVSNTGLCGCGETGCLEAFCSADAVSRGTGARLKDSWDFLTDEALAMLAKALRVAYKVTGTERVIIGGEGASVPDASLEKLRALCPLLNVNRSVLGDKAVILSAAETALDSFFFHTSMLEDMSNWV